MAVFGNSTAKQAMKIVCKELEVDGVAFAPAAQAAAIADLTITGTYGTDDDGIKVAIDSIIAVLVANGMVAAS